MEMDDRRSRSHHHRHGSYSQSYSRPPETLVMPSMANESRGHSHHHHRREHSHSYAPQVVTASGPQVITPTVINGTVIGGGHDGTTVINADAPRERRRRRRRRDSDRDRYFDSNNPSALHGLWNKFLGAITFNSRRRRHGDREMRRAKERRHALRLGEHVQDLQESGYRNKLKKRFRRKQRHHDHSHHQAAAQVIVAQDGGNGRRPWMHHHRAHPPYVGMGDMVLGFMTGNRDRRALGKALYIAANEQRKMERQRRRDEMSHLGREYRKRKRRWF